MDVNKRLKISRYIFGVGFVVFPIEISTSISSEWNLMLFLYFAGCLAMAVGLYLNLNAKGLNPFKKKRFYATIPVLAIFPVIGPLVAILIMLETTDPAVPTHKKGIGLFSPLKFGTKDPAAPKRKWRTVLFSPSMIILYCLIAFGIIAYPQIYSIRARGAHAVFKSAQYHFTKAKESESNLAPAEEVRKEIDEAADALVSARRSVFTDANTGWYVRYFLSSSIVKESELAELEAAIAAAKASGPGRIN